MTSPIRDNDGVVDSDLLLKWGGAVLALLLLAARGFGGFLGFGPDALPSVDSIALAFLSQFGSAAAYVTKHRLAGSRREGL